MSHNTLFLAWQDKHARQDKPATRAWFPVGRLDVNRDRSEYYFGYTRGAKTAAKQSGFVPLYDFPEFEQRYTANYLFPLFQNRVMTRRRKSFHQYLELLGIDDPAPAPFEILAVDGGYRVTDDFQVFPRIEKGEDGAFRCRFFLHGWRHTTTEAQKRIERLQPRERLSLAIELTNPSAPLAVQLQTVDYYMIGWAPRYLVLDLVKAMAHTPGEYDARVVKVNPPGTSLKQRVLIELGGRWPKEHEPMSSKEFELLVPA